jgi:hypothetical protein
MGWGRDGNACAGGIQEGIIVTIWIFVRINIDEVCLACLERELSRDLSECQAVIELGVTRKPDNNGLLVQRYNSSLHKLSTSGLVHRIQVDAVDLQ